MTDAQILVAEKARDAELARLQARHARDKHIITTLKLKLDKQKLALARAEDVPQHEAEVYLDLLGASGKNGAPKISTGGMTGAASGSDEASDISDERGMQVRDEEQDIDQLLLEEEKSGAAVETAEWTGKAVEANQRRRQEFKKKMKDQ